MSEEAVSSMTSDEVLPIVMWAVATAALVVNVVVLALGVVRKREIPVDGFLIHNLLFCYLLLCLHPYIVLSINIIFRNDLGSEDTIINALCSVASFVGVATSTMCMWTMVTLAGSFLLRLLLPRRFKNLKSYLNGLRIVLITEWVLVGVFATVPLIPFPAFATAQANSRALLCLPLHTMMDPLWIYTLVLASMDGLSIIILLVLIVVTACQLHRLQCRTAGMTPMEARVTQKNAALVKRVGLMMLSTVAFRFPGVVAIFGANLSVDIPNAVFQWVFGIVLPFSGIIGPVIYVFYAGLEDTTMEACLRSCRKKAVKGGSALRIGLGQLTGAGHLSRGADQSKASDSNTALANGMGPHTHDTLPRGSNRAPSEALWVESVITPARPECFGIVEWQTSNGSPRRGLLQTFPPDSYQQWKTEALVLSRLQGKQYHPHITECLWHSNSSKSRIDRGTGREAARPVYLERYICTTYYKHGCLQQFLPKFLDQFTESALHSVACQVSHGLAFLHANNVVHTRLESANVMVGGNPESKLKVVISNFTNAVDYAKPPRQEPPVYRAGSSEEHNEGGKTELMMPWAKGDKKGSKEGDGAAAQAAAAEDEKSSKPVFSNDVRSFAVLLMEMMAWLKQKKVDQGLDGPPLPPLYHKNFYWDRSDAAAAAVIGARLAGEGSGTRSGGSVPSGHCSPHDSHDALAEVGSQMIDGSRGATEASQLRPGPSLKSMYYANQAYAVDELRSRRAMSDVGMYCRAISRKVDRTNAPQRPNSGIADFRDAADIQTDYMGQSSEKHTSKATEGVSSDCNRNNILVDGSCLKDNPNLASTFPRRSMMSDLSKSNKRYSLCSSDSGISSPCNSTRSSSCNKRGRIQSGKSNGNLKELGEANGIKPCMSDSEVTCESAISKLRGVLDSTVQTLKIPDCPTAGESCQEDSILEFTSKIEEHRKKHQKQNDSGQTSDEVNDLSKSNTEKAFLHLQNKLGDPTSNVEKEAKMDTKSDSKHGNGDGSERPASSLSKFYVRKKSVTPINVGIAETLTPPTSRPVSRASSVASLLDCQDHCRAKSCIEGSQTFRKYSLGAMKHEGQLYQPSLGSGGGRGGAPPPYGYYHATLPRDMQVRARCRTMDPRAMTLSRVSDLQMNQAVANRNGWGYSHPMALQKGGLDIGMHLLPQAMQNEEHFFISTVPSGMTQHHTAYSQLLLDGLPCLKVGAGGQDKLVGVGDTHMAIMEWLHVVKESDSCLNKQLLNILKACWTQEPCPEAGDVHCMLNNCVTEVPL